MAARPLPGTIGSVNDSRRARRFAVLAAIGAVAAFAAGPGAANAQTETPVPGLSATPCIARQLSGSVSADDGAFDGTSHTGVRLTIRNVSRTICSIRQVGDVSVLGTHEAPLPIAIENPPVVGMNPGPVLIPIALAPGASASMVLRWIDAKVIDDGVCIATSAIRLNVRDAAISTPLAATMCGPAGGVTFQTTLFKTADATSTR